MYYTNAKTRNTDAADLLSFAANTIIATTGVYYAIGGVAVVANAIGTAATATIATTVAGVTLGTVAAACGVAMVANVIREPLHF